MKKNPSIVFPEPGKAVIEELDMPLPGAGQVLIKSSRTMVSIGTEMTAFCGEFPMGSNWEKFFSCPYYPGYNNIGTVVELGQGVDKSMLGKKLATGGKHAAYVIEDIGEKVSADTLKAAGKIGFFEVPEILNDDHSVFFTIPEIVMNGVRSSKVAWGECAVVYGLGLLGQFAVRFCRKCGAAPVLAVDVSPDRLNYLPKDSGVIGINPKEQDVLDMIKKHNHGRLADVVFEITGNAKLMEKELSVLREKGRLLLLSSPKEKVIFDFQDFCAWPSYTIIGCHNFSHPTHPQSDNPWTIKRHVELFFDLVGRGELDIDRLISRQVDYTDAPGVYQDLRQDRSKDMGIIFKWDNAK
ncbi:MAG: Alcohol dehydrogenase zinc-binding domain protein [Candidatus Uhrbacteria bacterium GW2011_GWF2_39_13]|uniref:Alcohol dehydrogenase zinc-binding domain protein n=1 Tax=Candidatus Uhrbacteria bacterium GW2011_GWF2_39_13 TaxID=1618995 RepID=A0A0G0QSZ2_9BACT|nr:MAG: Alcohol dehydrogenase zinc-binding domain protein [Candidatus Uhrbacteria bacterium GW2011_GWF2_39_13]